MKTIMIDGNSYSTAAELHHALKIMLELPDYYGANADALNDCLSERREPVNAWILSRGAGDVERAVSLCMNVIADNGGKVTEL
ncbi:MAG: barstar family protein [Clostridia bacterium]|nr:barstar family protein [Clostridia bacterium]